MTTAEASTSTWGSPNSKLILPVDAPREKWLELRKTGIGGSDAAALLGENPYSDGTPYFVWLDKTDPEYQSESNSAMERGSRMEPIVREMFEEKTGIKTRRQGMHQSREFPNLLASVDALAEDGGGWEGKTASQWVTRNWDEDVCPDYYAAQGRHYLAVTGRSHWHVSALDIESWKLWHWTIERDEEQLEYESTVKQEFWKTYILPRVAPDPDLARITSEEIKRRFPKVEAALIDYPTDSDKAQQIRDTILYRRALADEIKESKKEYDQTSVTLGLIAGGYEEVRVGGKKAFTMKASGGKGRVTNERIQEVYPEVDLDLCRVKPTGRTLYVDTKIWK